MIDAAGLRVMRAIAEEGSFTAAATSLGYTQPAISQMVRRLEQRTGTVLVERSGRSVRLTEAGEVLARHAVTVLGALEVAEAEVAAIAGLRAGRVRLMAFPSSSATLVPAALARLRASYPEITVRLHEGEPPQALRALREGECDLAVAFAYQGMDDGDGGDSADLDGLEVRDLLADEVHVALPLGHPLARADVEEIDLADLAAEPWVAGCPRCRAHLVSLADGAGFRPDVAFEIEDYVAQTALVAAGLGVALVPRLVLSSAHHEAIVTRPVRGRPTRVIQAVTTRDLLRVPAVAATVDALCAVAADLR